MRIRDWVIALALLAAVFFAVLAMGGVLRWTQAVTAVLVAVSVVGTALSRRAFARPSPLAVLLLVASGLTALQLIPLPDAIAERIAPVTASMRTDGADLLETKPWSAATGDAGATLGALIMLLTLLGIAVVALRIATTERGRYRIVASVGALCGITAVISGLHRLLELPALYGLYTPEYAQPQVLGPLLNANSLACLMAVGVALGIGLAAHRRQPGWLRVLWLLLVPTCGAVVVATVSRGGTIALIVGSLVTVGVLVAQRISGQERSRRRRTRFLSSALPIGVLAGCVTVLVIWSNAANVERQLGQLSFDEVHQSRSKFAAWGSAAKLIEEQPWLGTGRGAFEASFTRVHEASGLATYSYLENEYLQAVVDWGIPGAIALAGVALWMLYMAARRWRDTALSAGVLGALTVVAAQSNVDFGLEFLGLAAPLVALAATVCYVPLRDTERHGIVRGIRIAHAAALVGGAALLLSSFSTALDEDRRELSRHPSLERVRASATRHPLDYYNYAVAAELLARDKDPRAIRLLNHAMALHPTHPQLHQMAARMLYADGFVAQSAIEYSSALRMTEQPKPLLLEILQRFPRDIAAAALPTDYVDLRVSVSTLQELKHADVARVWLGRVLDLRPKSTQACELLFSLAQAGDLEAADVAGRRCADRLPDYQGRVALAKLLVSKQAYDAAIRLLQDVETWQSRRDEKVDAWLILCDARRVLDATEAKRCLRRLDASPDMLNERRAEIITRIEEINNAKPPATGSAATPPATGSAVAP